MKVSKIINKNALKINAISPIYVEIAKRMIERLDYTKLNPKVILDIGSGLHIDGKNLLTKYPQAQLIELDCAVNMLKYYSLSKRSQITKLFKKNNHHLICADAVNLPLVSQNIDLVWSNLVLPYIANYEAFFKEIRRVLNLGGAFFISGLGVDSLSQLRDVGFRTANFPDMHLIGDILVKLGFSDPVTDIEYITLTYDDFRQLIAEVRLVGAGGGTTSQTNFLSKATYFELEKKFANLTRNGLIPLTLEVFYAHAWKDKVVLDLPPDSQVVQFRR